MILLIIKQYGICIEFLRNIAPMKNYNLYTAIVRQFGRRPFWA